jgi:hypothetical protein
MLSYWTDGQQGKSDASLAEGEENGGFGSNTNVCIIVFTHFALMALQLMYSRDIKERDARSAQFVSRTSMYPRYECPEGKGSALLRFRLPWCTSHLMAIDDTRMYNVW